MRHEQRPPKRNERRELTDRKHMEIKSGLFFNTATVNAWIGLLLFLRNEKKQCANCAWIAKSVTEKNNSRVDSAETCKKTVQAMRHEW